MAGYYSEEDLARLAEVGADGPELWESYQRWYAQVFAEGALTSREKSLVALAVAHALACPYSIDAYAEECLEQGYSMAQLTEAVHVAAAIRGGSSLMHGLQMRKTAKRVQKR